MELLIHPKRLYFNTPFKIAHGTFEFRDAVIIELKEGRYSGFGEATVITYYEKSLEKFITILEANRKKIENYKFDQPENFWNYLYPELKMEPFILCALDIAAHDLWAKKMRKPLYKAWGFSLNPIPLSNFTISIDTIENMVKQMQRIESPIYKIKLGTKEDIEIVRALRRHTKAIFRVDANCAWTVEETIKNAIELKKLGVEFIEQPLPKDAFKEMELVFQNSMLPVIADESCQLESDVEKCHPCFHGINIKLMKCGGYTPALRMIKKAKSLNMKVMVGCMSESSVGISAIAHLLPLLDYVDMDGAMLLKEDPATGVKIKSGKVFFNKKNGIGAALKKEI